MRISLSLYIKFPRCLSSGSLATHSVIDETALNAGGGGGGKESELPWFLHERKNSIGNRRVYFTAGWFVQVNF